MRSPRHADIAVLIATSNRPELLARALRSVQRQTIAPARIVVVDDSDGNFQAPNQRLVEDAANAKYLRNSRSKGAAGAWNDGLDHLLRVTPDPRQLYVAILDDDDEWEPDHLQTCLDAVKSRQFDIVAAPLWRHENDNGPKLRIPPESLDAADFLVGNPNIQGSNLFCRLSVLLEAGLFDEWLPSCTDRDLCIRIADLPDILYGTTEKPTVRHHASQSRGRLSTPGGWAKNEGLSRFFAKYRGRMDEHQQATFHERAERLFGWSETVPNQARPRLADVPLSSCADAARGPAPHLVVGTIADAASLGDLAHLLGDLQHLAAQPELAGLDVVVLENSGDRCPSRKLRDLVERQRKRGLRIVLVDRAQHMEDAEAGRVLDGGVANGDYLAIAPARTVLQSYLYAFSKRRPGAIVWIVDDDLQLNPLVADASGGLQRQVQPLLPVLRKLQALRDSGTADVVIGRCTGDPPVPFAAAVRTQLVDLAASLLWLTKLPPEAALPDRAEENAALRRDRRDYYYDLSRRETDRLETPFWITPEESGERIDAAFERIANRAERILAGEQLFRPLVIEAEMDPLALGQGLQRGGNTFVLDVETLRLAPNPSPTIAGRPTRRSDMMWALLQQRHFGRKVVTVPFALHQDRSGADVNGLDVDRVLDDMRGYALFSALEAVPDVLASGNERRLQLGPVPTVDRFVSRVRKFLNERLAAFRLSFHRVRGLAGVLRDLTESDAAWWRDEKYQDARNQLRALCDHLDASYDDDVLAAIEQAVAAIRDSEIKTFITELPAELERHRARLADISGMARGFERERIANAKVVANLLEKPAGPLCALGCGGEGVSLTDGEHVYKVFDYWKSWQRDDTLGYLRSLVDAWRDTRSLYPLLAFRQEGRDAVLKYPFESSEPYTGGHGPGLVDLLVECRRQGVLCHNIHPDNLRVVGDRVRLIDYGSDIHPLDDEHGFTTMCRRAWLSFRCHDRPDLKALMRRALNQTDLPELAGFERFHEAVLRMAGERLACEDVALKLVGQPLGSLSCEGAARAPRLKALSCEGAARERAVAPRAPRLKALSCEGQAPRAPRLRALDYGCGSGGVAGVLAGEGAEVLGYDPDTTRWKRWRPLCEARDNLRFTTERNEALEGAALRRFDLVFCQRVICTVEDDLELRRILDDLRAAVADDGRVVVTFCDPRFTFGGPTPEAERELPPGARHEETFVWRKTVRTSGRKRREVHRPEEQLQAEFARAGLRETRRATEPTVDLMRFQRASDHLALELAPIVDGAR